MCQVDVYFNRGGQEELFMAGVDRIIPGEDDRILMENLIGERRIIKARIKDMALTHHRLILEEISEAKPSRS